MTRAIAAWRFWGGRIALGLAVCALITVACGSPGQAQFLKLGPLTYTDGHTSAIVAEQESGRFVVFITVTDRLVPVQEFSPETLPSEGVRTLAFRIDVTGYPEIVLPGNDIIKVLGSFSLRIDHSTLSCDLSRPKPFFCTLSSEWGGRGSILGLMDQEIVFNLGGTEAIALLEANQLHSRKFKDLIHQYDLGPDRKIYLDGSLLSSKRVGVSIDIDSPCLIQGARIVSQASADEIQASRTRNDLVGTLTRIKAAPGGFRSLDDFLPLSITPDSIVALEMSSGEFGVIEKYGLPGSKLCAFRTVKVR